MASDDLRVSSLAATPFQMLLTGDFQTRWESVKLLVEAGESVIPPLIALLQEEELDWEIHWFIARVLGQFDRPEVIAALLQLFDSEFEEVRQSAAAALTAIGPSAVAALNGLLQQPHQRRRAAMALCCIRHRSTLKPLLALCSDPDVALRAAVTAAIGSYGAPEVVEPLCALVQDTAPPVRIEAVKALAVRGQLLDRARLISLLLQRLHDEDAGVVRAAIAGLGRYGSEQTVDAIATTATAPSTPIDTVLLAVQTLGWMEIPAAVAALANLFDRKPGTRALQAIVRALGRQPRSLAAQATEILLDREVVLRSHPYGEMLLQEYAMGLGQLGAACGWAALEHLLHHDDEGVRLHSAAALRQRPASEDGSKW